MNKFFLIIFVFLVDYDESLYFGVRTMTGKRLRSNLYGCFCF